MNYRRWLKIKRIKKISNNDTETRKVQDGYNPSYKFDYIWRCVIHNVNFITNNSKLDICGDETRWSTASYGEAGAGITGLIDNKTGITNGGQKVLVSDIHSVRMCAYSHRHKLHMNPPECNVWGKIEVKEIMEGMKLMAEGEGGGERKIFCE